MSLPIPIIATAWQRKYITDMKEFCGPIGRMYTPAELQASSKLHCELSDGRLRGRSSHRMLSRLAVPLVEVESVANYETLTREEQEKLQSQ